MANNQDTQIAQTIIQQLGGVGRLSAMTSAKHFVALPDGVAFRIGRNSKKVNLVKIRLNGRDLYDLEFSYATVRSYKAKGSATDVFCENLVDVFEEHTGLYLTLAPRAAA